MDHAAFTLGPPVIGASNPGTSRVSPGGVALNVARDLARLGRRVRLVTRVGADSDGEAIVAAAEADGIDASRISVSTTARTATYRASFDDAGGLIIGIADMAVMDEVTVAGASGAVAEAAEEETHVIDANLPAGTLAFLVDAAARRGRPVAAVSVSPAKAVRLAPLLGRLTLLFATRREAAAMLGRDDDPALPTLSLATLLAARGVAHVIVTNSGDPLAAATAGEAHLFAPFPAAVRSVNGAGDALAAGTLHGLAEGRSFFDAVLAGLAAAAITVEEDDTVAAGLAPAEVEARIAKARIVA
ncbi:MAG TPA: PfkB family carbohydrate kinase [Bauldia sp.]|nr:PfkB family carbohydrate kinase [Bauldia sp.]